MQGRGESGGGWNGRRGRRGVRVRLGRHTVVEMIQQCIIVEVVVV